MKVERYINIINDESASVTEKYLAVIRIAQECSDRGTLLRYSISSESIYALREDECEFIAEGEVDADAIEKLMHFLLP